MSQNELVEDKDQFEDDIEYIPTETNKRIRVEKSRSNVNVFILTGHKSNSS